MPAHRWWGTSADDVSVPSRDNRLRALRFHIIYASTDVGVDTGLGRPLEKSPYGGMGREREGEFVITHLVIEQGNRKLLYDCACRLCD
ncbi:hypothetical protein EVAR_102744_1 [Eumeta japonica]|uniref:Uncharacterized protein n=1 Tax=Eumeta variegata TaxID=151549 RepID=A0A4C1TIW8_EUMVA|nr:hypothetical protein EVAR_102744_1 [Eumeta japonica]